MPAGLWTHVRHGMQRFFLHGERTSEKERKNARVCIHESIYPSLFITFYHWVVFKYHFTCISSPFVTSHSLQLNLISSTGTYAAETMPTFFIIGYGLPMTQGVTATRTIMFGSYNRMGRNLGMLGSRSSLKINACLHRKVLILYSKL